MIFLFFVKIVILCFKQYYLFELNQSCYDQPECKKATSKCVDYLDSNLIDEQWLLNNHLVVYSACCCYHKSLNSSIKEAHDLDFNNPLL